MSGSVYTCYYFLFLIDKRIVFGHFDMFQFNKIMPHLKKKEKKKEKLIRKSNFEKKIGQHPS